MGSPANLCCVALLQSMLAQITSWDVDFIFLGVPLSLSFSEDLFDYDLIIAENYFLPHSWANSLGNHGMVRFCVAPSSTPC